jgi:hypothetical protein
MGKSDNSGQSTRRMLKLVAKIILAAILFFLNTPVN